MKTVAILFLTAIATVVWAATPESLYREGREYAARKDWSRAIKCYQSAAKDGYAPAINSLGCCYFCGRGVSCDLRRAAQLFQKAAAKGDAKAINNVGFCHLYGVNLVCYKWFAADCAKNSAAAGNPAGLYNLADLYRCGIARQRDDKTALALYEESAAKGFVPAMESLAICYAKGEMGVPRNSEKAEKWLLAAGNDNIQAKKLLAAMKQNEAAASAPIFAHGKLDGTLKCSATIDPADQTLNWTSAKRNMTLHIVPELKDWSMYHVLRIQFSASRAGDVVMLKLDSNPPESKTWNFFFFRSKIARSGLQTLEIPLNKFFRQRHPVGFNQIQSLDFVFGWGGVKNEPGLKLKISRIVLQ